MYNLIHLAQIVSTASSIGGFNGEGNRISSSTLPPIPLFCYPEPYSNLLFFLCFSLSVEWTLYEQVAIAAMDCQCLDVAKV